MRNIIGHLALTTASPRVLYAVLVDSSESQWLRAAACTWMRFVHPRQVLLVTERNISLGLRGACSSRPWARLDVKTTIDYSHVVRKIYKATDAWDWLLLAHAYSLVRPKKLTMLLEEQPDEFGAYTGWVRTAADSPFLGYPPHAAHEKAVLLSRAAVEAVAVATPTDHDFRAAEYGSAVLATTLWDKLKLKPTHNARFGGTRASLDWMLNGVTLGPLTPQELRDAGEHIWRLRGPEETESTPSIVAFAVLVRESRAHDVVKSIQSTWAKSYAHVYFFAETNSTIPLGLGACPPKDTFYTDRLSKTSDWEIWLRRKVARTVRYFVDRPHVEWLVVVDDDTWIDVEHIAQVVRDHDPSRKVALGRKFASVTRGSLVAGGPGIVMSRAAVAATKSCPEDLPIISNTVSGGDGWLGQCLSSQGVRISDDWRFKSFPPTSYADFERHRYATFHRWQPMADTRPPLGCQQLYHWTLPAPVCAPAFTILGAQKAGTTTLHYVLGQHPNISLPKRKELNFWGSPWADKHVSVRDFLFTYLRAMPLSDVRVSGESSPDYLYSAKAPRNMVRFLPRMKLIVSLREPIDRAASAYHNKKADKSIHRYLDVSHRRLDDAFDSVPTFDALVLDVNATLFQCPQHRHYTLRRQGTCYVNPFVHFSLYDRYLDPWLRVGFTMLVLDYDDLKKAPFVITRFLGLPDFPFDTTLAYNTRTNRGVHPPGRRPRIGARVSATRGYTATTWALDGRSTSILADYFREPNSRLADRLDTYGHKRPKWLLEER